MGTGFLKIFLAAAMILNPGLSFADDFADQGDEPEIADQDERPKKARRKYRDSDDSDSGFSGLTLALTGGLGLLAGGVIGYMYAKSECDKNQQAAAAQPQVVVNTAPAPSSTLYSSLIPGSSSTVNTGTASPNGYTRAVPAKTVGMRTVASTRKVVAAAPKARIQVASVAKK